MSKITKPPLKYDQAYYWPAWLAASLPAAQRRLLPAGQLKNLCQANLDLWLALNLYDDCLDSNQAGPALLKANRHYRRFLSVYFRLVKGGLFDKTAHQIIDQLETANHNELAELRLKISGAKIALPTAIPRFGPITDLAAKSQALALAPAAAFSCLALNYKRRRLNQLLNFFRLALAAKQLADDIKDWRDDLKHGHLTRANWQIIRHFQGTSLSFKSRVDVNQLDYIFIRHASLPLAKQLARLCRRARQAAKDCGWPDTSPLTNNLLKPIEQGLQETQALRAWLSGGGL